MPLELLSRIQFGFTVTFHILFPAFTIGLITFIAVFETIWLKTRNPRYLALCKFWTKVLALTFGMGIVSGVVMEFQLGTNWAHFTHASGNFLGVLFTYEVLTAFFIEAGFLGVMFFGWNRVSPELHYASTILALVGVTVSAFWILCANSWMQMPSGVSYHDGIFDVLSWSDAIFNPTFLPRFFHMLVGTYIAALFAILAISAYYLLKKQHERFAKTCYSSAIWALLILLPLQIIIGDTVGLNVHTYQPLKTAAIEAVWETQNGAPLVLFGWPDEGKEENRFTITLPKLASLINTHHFDGELVGLKSVPPDERPPVPVVFFSFRIMVGLGILMLALAIAGAFLDYKKRAHTTPWLLKASVISAPFGFLAIITGWFTAEFGRQPWTIYTYLKTAAAHSPIQIYQIAISLISIIVVYGIIFGYFYFRYLFKIIAAGPSGGVSEEDSTFTYLLPTMKDPK